MCVTDETVIAKTTINASAEAVFAVLADPSTHAAIDGTGWVRESLDDKLLTETGQIFRMHMYHEGHPDKDYEMENRVVVLDPPCAIAWQPGYRPDGTDLVFPGWFWRHDLAVVGPSETEVTLTYDWSGVPPSQRDIEFPPFELQHLDNSLQHLAALAEQRA
jgi:hypothetical protein